MADETIGVLRVELEADASKATTSVESFGTALDKLAEGAVATNAKLRDFNYQQEAAIDSAAAAYEAGAAKIGAASQQAALSVSELAAADERIAVASFKASLATGDHAARVTVLTGEIDRLVSQGVLDEQQTIRLIGLKGQLAREEEAVTASATTHTGVLERLNLVQTATQLASYAIVGGFVAAGAAAVSFVEHSFELTASLDEMRRKFGTLYGDVSAGNDAFNTAAAFAEKYGYTQLEVETAVSQATEAIKNSHVPLTDQLRILGQLAEMKPGETIQQAAAALEGLASGGRSIQDVAKELNLTKDQADLLKKEIRDGKDAFVALDDVMKNSGITSKILDDRLQGTAGAVRTYKQAQEDAAKATGEFAAGPGVQFLEFQAKLVRGFAAMFDGGKALAASFMEQRQAIEITSTSYADYIAKAQAYAAEQGFQFTAEQLGTQAKYDSFQATVTLTKGIQDAAAATADHTQTTQVDTDAILRNREAELADAQAADNNKAAIDLAAQATNAFTDATGSNSQALAIQANQALFTQAQHEALATAEDQARAAAINAIGGYDASGAALINLGLAAIFARNNLAGYQAQQAQAKLQAQDPGFLGLPKEVQNAQIAAGARDLIDPAAAVARLKAVQQANDAINKSYDAATKKAAEAATKHSAAQQRDDLAGLTPAEAADYWKRLRDSYVKGSTEYLNADAEYKTKLAEADRAGAKGGSSLASAQDAAAVAGQSHEARLAYWQGQLAADKKGSAEYFRDLAHIRTEQAAIDKANAAAGAKATKDAIQDQNLQDRATLAGLDLQGKIDFYQQKLANEQKGSDQYLKDYAALLKLQAEQKRAVASAAAKQDTADDALARAKLAAAEAGQDHAVALGLETQYLDTLTKGTTEYYNELTKVRDLEKQVADDRDKAARAATDAALDRVHDAQQRYKEDQELATDRRILASGSASSDQKQQAQLAIEAILLERDKRQEAIASKDKEAALGTGAAGGTLPPRSTDPRTGPVPYRAFDVQSTASQSAADALGTPSISMNPNIQVRVFVGGKELIDQIKVEVNHDRAQAWNIAAGASVGQGV